MKSDKETVLELIDSFMEIPNVDTLSFVIIASIVVLIIFLNQ